MLFSTRAVGGWNSGWAGVGRWLLALGCLALGCMVLAAGGCGSNATVVQDFTLAVTPASVALTAGGATQQITVTSTAVNGYNAQIAISLSGLPAGVTANPASAMIMPGATERRESFRRGAAGGGEATGVLGEVSMLQEIAGYWDTRL